MIRILYIAASVGMLGLFAAHGLFGYDLFSDSARTELPANVRQSPGGYRTYIFWQSGYQGGK